MEESRYIISDVVKKTGIEPHVLRYWEKELHLDIPRNEFGHRFYLDKHIELFIQIHKMKEGGFQLKAIKTLIPPEFLCSEELQARGLDSELDSASNLIIMNKFNDRFAIVKNKAGTQVVDAGKSTTGHDKIEQFKGILSEVITDVLKTRDEAMGTQISEKVIKQMDYLMRLQDELEEERFKRLDETIRLYQKEREAAGKQIWYQKLHKKSRS